MGRCGRRGKSEHIGAWLLVFATLMGVVVGSTNIHGDSIIDDSLRSITQSEIVVVTAGLNYDAIPQLDLPVLSQRVHDVTSVILEEHGIQPRPKSEQSVVIAFSKMRIPGKDGYFVVKTTMRLREPAILSRQVDGVASIPVVVTSWDSWRWTLVTTEDAHDKILGSVNAIATEFGQAVARARSASAKSSVDSRECKHVM
jgi:hypothetical protein